MYRQAGRQCMSSSQLGRQAVYEQQSVLCPHLQAAAVQMKRRHLTQRLSFLRNDLQSTWGSQTIRIESLATISI